MEKYLLALDQGTTSSRAIIFDKEGHIKAKAQKEFTQLFPQPGWVEHNPKEIWQSQSAVIVEAMTKMGITEESIVGIGITNQRETTIVWDAETGEPVYNAIVWQDRRTSAYCDELKRKGLVDRVHEKTGVFVEADFSGSKIGWILEKVAGARGKAEAGLLRFGNVDAWLIWKLTNGTVHATDVSNASRTMLFNINTLQWDEDLLKLLDIPVSLLPEVKSSSEIYGSAQLESWKSTVPIAGVAGDQQAALFGQMCIKPGSVKNTYGTGCFIMLNTGKQVVMSQNNLLTTVAWKIGNEVNYALEGSVYVGGSVVQWLRDGLGIIRKSSEIEELARSVPDSGGVFFVPALTGLAAPYWDQYARGTIVGLTRGTTAAHIARAALEGIAFQVYDIVQAMARDLGAPLEELKVDGGASANELMLQFQSDLLAVKVIRPLVTETTAQGAAFLAGLAVGYWKSIEQVKGLWKEESVFSPSKDDTKISQAIEGWHDAVRRTLTTH